MTALRRSKRPSSARSQRDLLLKTLLCRPEEARAAWRTLRPTLDIDELDTRMFFLLPGLYRRLLDLGIDDRDIPRLKGIYRRTWYAQQVLGREVAPLLRMVSEARIDVLVLDSVPLAFGYYERPPLRPTPYLELLVQQETLKRMLQIADSTGFHCDTASLQSSGFTPIAFRNPSGILLIIDRAPPLDLAVPGRPLEWADDLWGDSVELEFAGQTVTALSPADELVLACVSGDHPTGGLPRPFWPCDAVAVIRRSGGALDWERVMSTARRRGQSMRLRHALAFLQDEYDVLTPAAVHEALAHEEASARQRLTYRIHSMGIARRSNPLRLVATYLRLTGPGNSRLIGSFPGFLCVTLGLESRRELLAVIVRKVGGGILRALARRPRAPAVPRITTPN